MIVATAGHVDHGKTSLVRALTGVDTDTLAEEQRRGLTIDVGFASTDLGDGAATAFLDLPGHERFIRNLLAGIAGVDVALLIVAADDGPMPQTREHLAILTLLGVASVAVVLTKIDRVTPERRTAAEGEVAAMLSGGRFAGARVFPVAAATSGAGLPALRQHLIALGRSLPPRDLGGHFRLAIDRGFTVTGAGRVVAGAVLSGSVQVGDRLIVSPAGASVRVRGLQAQGRPVDRAMASERVAVNIAGGSELRAADTARGDWLLAPPAHAPTARLDVALDVVQGAPRPLADRDGLLLHLGAAAVPLRLVVLFGAAIGAGASGHAQLLLDQPVAAVAGDRFIIRDPADPRGVIAGGRVLDPFAPARGRQRAARARFLAAMALASPLDALRRLMADAPRGVALDRFAVARNLTQPEVGALLRTLEVAVIVDSRDGLRWALAPTHWQALREQVRRVLAAWHVEQPESVGPSEAALAVRLQAMLRAADADVAVEGRSKVEGRRDAPGAPVRPVVPAAPVAPVAALLNAALGSLVAEGAAAREGLRCRLTCHRAVLSPTDATLLARVASLLELEGLRPPIVGDLAAALDLPLPALLDALGRIGRHGALVPVAANRYFLPATVMKLADHARHLSRESPDAGRFDAAAYRDRTGIGRNLTVQVLEFLDREGVTRFDGTRRRAVAGDAGNFDAGTATDPTSSA